MIFSEDFTLSTLICDEDDRLTLWGLARLFQDVAGDHSDSLGVGFEGLKPQNKAWVLTHVYYNILRLPSAGERLTLKTWPKPDNGLIAPRDYQLIDAEGNNVGVVPTSKALKMAEEAATSSGRAIITVLGSDRSGIVAVVAGALAQHDVNILDISQTILQGIFTMTMLVDLGGANVEFSALQSHLEDLSQELGVQITMQREEVFRFMYRL